MSTKRASIATLAALLVIAVTATTAQARPSPGIGTRADPGAGPGMGAHSHLKAGHHAASGAVEVPQPVVPAAKAGGSEGVSAPTVFALMALALLAGALIAIWTAARTGHVTRERAVPR